MYNADISDKINQSENSHYYLLRFRLHDIIL